MWHGFDAVSECCQINEKKHVPLTPEDGPGGKVPDVLHLVFIAPPVEAEQAHALSHGHGLNQVRAANAIGSADCVGEIKDRTGLHCCEPVLTKL